MAWHLLPASPTSRGVFLFFDGIENKSQKAPGGPKTISSL